jgi:hypothetical protein
MKAEVERPSPSACREMGRTAASITGSRESVPHVRVWSWVRLRIDEE